MLFIKFNNNIVYLFKTIHYEFLFTKQIINMYFV